MTQIFDSLGWALLHSLWQGGLAMLAVIAFRAMTKNGSPSLRYNFQILCLFGSFAAFLVTFGIYQSSGEAPAVFKTLSPSETVSQAAALFIGSTDGLKATSQSLSLSAASSAPLLGILWCLGFAFMAMRYLTAYLMTQKLRHTGLSETPDFWQRHFRTLVLNTGVSEKVRIFISDHVSGPLTIGFMKPVVLVPAGFLMGLPRDQVEAILLHELAHIRRYDYLVNLFQTAVKTALFFHPAIHYISKKIDIDREQACDDFAVMQSRDPKALIRGLVALRLHSPGTAFAMAADDGETPLMDRLKRLVGSVEHQRRPEHLLMPLIATLLIGGIYLSTTSIANAHQEPKDYSHAKADKENYRFETKRINGRNVTIKITEDGRRWVLTNGAWVDIDKNPRALKGLPVAMPQPPQPPKLPKRKDGEYDRAAFDAKMNQFEIDMDYFEADLERYFEENKTLSADEQEHLEKHYNRKVDQVERQAERMEEKIERDIERAQDERERAQERVERQQERAEEQRKKIKKQAKRDARKMTHKNDKQHAKYDQMRETLYGYLINDGFISSRTQKATMRFTNNNWTANGRPIPSYKENKYCELFANTGIKKATLSKIEITSSATHIVSKSRNGKQSHKITIGEFTPTDATKHNTAFDPVSPAPPAAAQPPIRKIKLDMDEFTPNFMWPTASKNITAVYGQVGKLWETSHHGVDFKGKIGAPIFASADGIVHRASNAGKWGNRIIIKHANGYQTLYAHMNSLSVSHGQSVKAGDIIGGIGSTGQSTGPHLHFEIRKAGQHIDPMSLIN